MPTRSRSVPRPLRPVDWLLAASNAGMVVLWLRLASEYAAAWWFAAIHLVAAALPLLLRLAPSPRGTVARSLWSAYPLGFLAVFWSELDLHGRLVSTTSFDAAVVRLDRAAFGVHVNQAWLAAMHGPVFSEIMHLLYLGSIRGGSSHRPRKPLKPGSSSGVGVEKV